MKLERRWRHVSGAMVCAAAAASGMLLQACASGSRAGATASDAEGMGELVLAPSQRDEAFAAAKDVLRELRFELNRIDAREGVLTTQAKFSSGLATPWDIEQSSVADEVRDLLHRQSRVVRVSFVPDGEQVRVEVSVKVQRMQAPGQKLAPRAVALSTTTVDVTPADGKSVREAGVITVVGRDVALEKRILSGVQERLAAD